MKSDPAAPRNGTETNHEAPAAKRRRRIGRLERIAGRLSARLSQAALLGLVAVTLTVPAARQRRADAAPVPAAADPISVRRVETRAVPAGPVVRAAADSPAPPAKPSIGKAVDTKPLPVPPAAAPSEQQPDTWTAAEVAEAKALCDATLSALKLTAEREPPLRNGACGTPAPLSVKRMGQSNVELQPAATVNCRLAVAFDKWIADTLQPAAQLEFQSPVTRILVASSYTCRNRYGAAGAPISEHAFANALDISGFVLQDGRTIKVLDAWGPTARDTVPASADTARTLAGKPAEPVRKPKSGQAVAAPLPMPISATPNVGNDPKRFLRSLHSGACGVFGTVLGPEANEAHRDHLHFDLKVRAHTRVCE